MHNDSKPQNLHLRSRIHEVDGGHLACNMSSLLSMASYSGAQCPNQVSYFPVLHAGLSSAVVCPLPGPFPLESAVFHAASLRKWTSTVGIGKQPVVKFTAADTRLDELEVSFLLTNCDPSLGKELWAYGSARTSMPSPSSLHCTDPHSPYEYELPIVFPASPATSHSIDQEIPYGFRCQ